MNIYFWIIQISSYVGLNKFAKNKFTIDKQLQYNNFADKRPKNVVVVK